MTERGQQRVEVLGNIGPNWFASVMGTGIVATAGATLPVHLPGLHAFTEIVWIVAALLLLVLGVLVGGHWLRHPRVARSHARNPQMAHFYGAAPMALLTVAAGALLVGKDLIGMRFAVDAAWVLWTAGTIGGLFTAVSIPFLMFTQYNVEPDAVSHKSLKTLDRKLVHLAEHARFHVNINSVVGSGMSKPQDPLIIARRAQQLGFSTSVGVLHDEHGQLAPLSDAEVAVFHEVVRIGQGIYTRINDFQENLIAGRPNDWHCRAGARYLYVCEDGKVHYCSQQRGTPGTPLEQYTVSDIRREFHSQKDCAPMCTIGCVHRSSSLDNIRPSRLLHLVPLRRPSRSSTVGPAATGSP
ncbi:MAG TPA: hypothetical protein PK493_09025 [Pseudomonadota bacterium]|nr:hypothetical protein [Pseudomonadota bacterium]